jgi:hypothetical protein
MATSLYTVIMEFEGTTSVIQMTATSVVEALEVWSHGLRQSEHYGLAAASARRLYNRIQKQQDRKPVNIRGTANVWCTSVLVGQNLALLNIVKTCKR